MAPAFNAKARIPESIGLVKIRVAAVRRNPDRITNASSVVPRV